MAVVAVWKCDRDGAMFDNKKDAEEHDKMLELAANITYLIEQHLDIDEKRSEAIGLLLAERRDQLAAACKGKPNALIDNEKHQDGDKPVDKLKAAKETNGTDESMRNTESVDSNKNKKNMDNKNGTVTPLAANQ